MERLSRYVLLAGSAGTVGTVAHGADHYQSLDAGLYTDGSVQLLAPEIDSRFSIHLYGMTADGGGSTSVQLSRQFYISAGNDTNWNVSWVMTTNSLANGVENTPRRLAAGAVIGAGQDFHQPDGQSGYLLGTSVQTFNGSTDQSWSTGGWAGPAGTTGFMGIRFADGSGDHYYGWIELTRATTPVDWASTNRLGADLVINSWYLNGTANQGVVAGQQGASAVPGLGGLVTLACGAAGVRRRRSRST